MVLNSLRVDPQRQWKRSPWRWYSEDMLDCCASIESVRDKGVCFDTLACLARCNFLATRTLRADTHSIDAFRADLKRVFQQRPRRDSSSSSSSGSESDTDTAAAAAAAAEGDAKIAPAAPASRTRLIVSFARGALNQTGGGHFSPLAAYHESRDLVLVLDVARFKLPSFWVPVKAMYAAMQCIDKVTSRSRGWMTLSPSSSHTSPLLFSLAINQFDLGRVVKKLCKLVTVQSPSMMSSSTSPTSTSAVVPTMLFDFVRSNSPSELRCLMCTWVSSPAKSRDIFAAMPPALRSDIAALHDAIQGTELYALVGKAMSKLSSASSSTAANSSSASSACSASSSSSSSSCCEAKSKELAATVVAAAGSDADDALLASDQELLCMLLWTNHGNIFRKYSAMHREVIAAACSCVPLPTLLQMELQGLQFQFSNCECSSETCNE
jgi:hypothetical protein